jgi:hypothetical protein
MLRWPALRRGLLVMPAVGVQKGAIARCALTGVRDRVLVLGRRGAAGRLHEIKQRSQQPVRAPRRSLLRLLRRPLRRCRQRQLVLETLGGAKASVLLGSRCRRRGLSLEAHGGLNPMPPALGSRLHASRWRSAQSPCTNYDRTRPFQEYSPERVPDNRQGQANVGAGYFECSRGGRRSGRNPAGAMASASRLTSSSVAQSGTQASACLFLFLRCTWLCTSASAQ